MAMMSDPEITVDRHEGLFDRVRVEGFHPLVYPVTSRPMQLLNTGRLLARALRHVDCLYDAEPVLAFTGTSGSAMATAVNAGAQAQRLPEIGALHVAGEHGGAHRCAVEPSERAVAVMEDGEHLIVFTDDLVSSGATYRAVDERLSAWADDVGAPCTGIDVMAVPGLRALRAAEDMRPRCVITGEPPGFSIS